LTDEYQTVTPSHNGTSTSAGSFEGTSTSAGRFGAYEDSAEAEDQPADYEPNLVSLGFLTAALRRGRRLWCAAAVAGLLIGSIGYVATRDPYQASTTLLLTLDPSDNVTAQASNDEYQADNQAMAQSRTVAGLAVRKLGLRQSISSFLSSYSATSVSDRVLVITDSASSSEQALLRANAIATAYLQFRAAELLEEQKLTLSSLEAQIGQAKQDISSLSQQINRLPANPASATQQSQLSSLQAERSQANSTLTGLKQAVVSYQTNTQPATAAEAKGSVVLNSAVPLPYSPLKQLLLYALIGGFIGLVLALAVVVIRALVSDRLRQRADIAQALGAPVKLSVGRVRLSRRRRGGDGLAAARDPDVRRITAYLDRAVPRNPRRPATLAVVPVDDPRTAALSLVSLALSRARQGEQVVLADLVGGAPAARLLGIAEPGVSIVNGHNNRLIIAVPDGDDVLPPGGPIGRAPTQGSPFTETVASACGRANLLLTLTTLDASVGGDHLATWATDAVAILTAGRSSWTTISAVGEMVRMSGTRLESAVLIGTDEDDQSIGVTYPTDDHDIGVPGQARHVDPGPGRPRDYDREHEPKNG
jgi:capsular polysaccharide biosynthesis protein